MGAMKALFQAQEEEREANGYYDDFDADWEYEYEQQYAKDTAEARRLGLSMNDFFQYQIDMDAMAEEQMDAAAEEAFCQWCDEMERQTAGAV